MRYILARAKNAIVSCLLLAGTTLVSAQTSPLQLIPGTASVVIGTGTVGNTLTQVDVPRGVYIDSTGNLFIADTSNQRILKITPAGVVSVYAGNHTGGFTGDGGLATAAELHGPEDITMDAVGNLYIADSTNNRIRMVTPAGTISTIAGSSLTAGYAGDGGQATSALLNTPWGVTFDPAGNLYIADEVNDCIREVNMGTQVISTFAGICTSSGFTGDGGAPTAAKLNAPKGVYFDAIGNAYICDTGNNRIREVIKGSNTISTIVGTGSATFNGDELAATSTAIYGPSGIAFDGAGALYINDSNNRIRRLLNGIVTTVAGTGASSPFNGGTLPATSTNIAVGPKVAIDATGDLYVGDATNERVWKILGAQGSFAFGNQGQGTTSATQTITLYNSSPAPVALTGLAITASYILEPATTCATGSSIASGQSCLIAVAFAPSTLGAMPGSVTISDNLTTQQILLTGTGTLAPVTVTETITPNPVNLGNNTVATIQVAAPASISTIPTGTVSLATGSTPLGSGTLSGGKTTVTFGSTLIPGTYPIIATYGGDTSFLPGSSAAIPLVVNGLTTAISLAIAPASPQILQPETLTATITHATGTNAPSGTVTFYNGTQALGTVSPVPANGIAVLSPTLSYGPHSITAVYSGDSLYNPATSSATTIFVGAGPVPSFTPGILATFAGTYGTGAGGYSGDGGQATTALLNAPYAVATDFQNNVYIGDCNNNRVRKVSGGIITTIAGTGTAGYTGDGGLAKNATLHCPRGLAVDNAGDVFVYDYFNAAVREITAAGNILTIAGNGVVGYSGDGGPATSAQINEGWGLGIDPAGNLYIADSGNNVIRMVSTNGTISTFAGTGNASSTGDGGAATSATLNNPVKVTLDASGNVYIAETGGNRVRKVTPSGTISTFAGTGVASETGNGGPATSATLDGPYSLAIDAVGDVYIGDRLASTIRMVNTSGIISAYAGNGSGAYAGNGGSALAGSIIAPWSIALDSAENLYIADTSSIGPEDVIREVIANSSVINFGTLIIGVEQPNPVLGTLTNTGTSALTITNMVLTGAGFTLEAGTPNGCSTSTVLAPGASCAYSVGFTYTTTGSFTGSLVFTDNAGNIANSTQTVALLATAVLPTPTVTLAITPTTFAAPGATVTMIATVTAPIVNPNVPNPAVPTGTVTFTANGNVIGTASINNGTATLTTATLGVGTYAVVASYGGSASYQSATSASQTYTVAYDFSIAATPTSAQIKNGFSMSGTVTLTPAMGLMSTITLSCSNLPYGYTCVFGSPTFTSDGSGKAFTTPLTIQYAAPMGQIHKTSTVALCSLFLCSFALFIRRRKTMSGIAAVALLSVIGFGLSGCTSSSMTSAANASYPISVIGTAGVVSHTASINLHLQ